MTTEELEEESWRIVREGSRDKTDRQRYVELAKRFAVEELEKARLFHFLPIYSSPKHLSDQEALLLGCKVQEQHIDQRLKDLQ